MRGVNTGRRAGEEEDGAASPPSVPRQPDPLGELSTPLGERSTPLGELPTPPSLRAEAIWLSTAAEAEAATRVLRRP